MKLATITLREADHGGYTYTKPEKIIKQIVSDDKTTLDNYIISLLTENAIFNHKTSIDNQSLRNVDDYEAFLKQQVEKMTDWLTITFWNDSNWSESTLEVTITNVTMI